MPGKATTIQHTVAARLTADSGRMSQEFIAAARGIKSFATQTGQAFNEVSKKADAFDQALERSMKRATASTQRASQQMSSAASRVGFQSGPLNVARQQQQQGSFMQRASAGYQASGMGSMVGMGLGMAGTAGVYQALAATRTTTRNVTDLMIQGDKDRGWAKQAEKDILAVSDATGKGRDEVASYAQMYARLTGNVDIAMKSLSGMGKVAVATGADFGDLAQITEGMVGGLKVKGEDSYKGMDIIAQQSKLGKVEFKSIAGKIGMLSAQAFRFGGAGEGLGALGALGGLFQISARGFGASQTDEVATSSSRFLERLAQNPEKVQKLLGVKLGTRRGGKFVWNQLSDVMQAIGTGVAGKDLEASAYIGGKKTSIGKELSTIFELEGMKPILQLAQAAKQGWYTKDAASGRESAAAIFGAKGGVLEGDYKKRMDDPAAQWDRAMNKMSNSLHRTMLPLLGKIADVLPSIGKVVDFLLTNSKELVALYASAKMVQVFRAIAMASGAGGGMGGGGAMGPGGAGMGMAAGAAAMGGAAMMAGHVMPGSDLAKLQAEQAARAYRRQQVTSGVLSALPLIPAAYMIGKSLGGKFNKWDGGGYGSIEDAERDQAGVDELGKTNAARKAWRLRRADRMATGRGRMKDWMTQTESGAVMKRDMDKDLSYIKVTKGLDAWDGGATAEVNTVGLADKLGPDGLSALRDRLQGYEGRLRSRATEEAIRLGETPGTAGFDKRVLDLAPELATLTPTLAALERALAGLIQGLPIKVNVTVPDPNSPGSRAGGRAGEIGKGVTETMSKIGGAYVDAVWEAKQNA